ncbi:hypothetical protein ETAA8_09440 [Anatilimnocola aggregata]|uniref:IrrE N-terminal-like domain-containing protein n=1 Tax=Anatilimnocola aggregata TaxID=2528021 RepID=A0A517Y6W2_9BACT|nr:hypothetical protein ETAA8_09440 [Anatilimnocola aggregata]
MTLELKNRPTLEAMKTGRERMRQRCEEVTKAILKEAGVESVEYHDKGLRGLAIVKKRYVYVPTPTTRRRLYIVAHEAGHVALKHTGSLPVHRKEYEAEIYAHDALRRHGVAVPAKSTIRAKQYVAYRIRQAVVRGAKAIDREALRWTRGYWHWKVEDWVAAHYPRMVPR